MDSLARLATIHMYPKSGIREAAALLDRCARFFPFPISCVLADNGACSTDRLGGRRGRPSGNHLFDEACNQHGIDHRLTKAYHPQTGEMVEPFNRRVSEVLKSIRFKDHKTMMKTPCMGTSTTTTAARANRRGGLSPFWTARDNGNTRRRNAETGARRER